MKTLFVIMLICLSFNAFAGEAIYESDRLACRFSYLESWQLDSSLSNRVTLTDSTNRPAIISISHYQIDSDNHIKSGSDLYNAIVGLYDDMGILSLTDNEIVYDINGGQADFEISYREYQQYEKTFYKKQLKGAVVKDLSGNQLFYLIIAQAPEDQYDLVQSDFDLIFNSFQITEDISENLYIQKDFLPYLQILLILALVVFFYSRNRRVQRSKNPLGRDSSSHWRCSSCGKVNHIDIENCNRCGEKRKEAREYR